MINSQYGPQDTDLARELRNLANREALSSRAQRAFCVSWQGGVLEVVGTITEYDFLAGDHRRRLDEIKIDHKVDAILHFAPSEKKTSAYAYLLDHGGFLHRMRIRYKPPPPKSWWVEPLKNTQRHWNSIWED